MKLLFVILLGLVHGAVGEFPSPNLDYRLPKTLRPTFYRLNMRMVLDEDEDRFVPFTAPSNITITIRCMEPTESIILNAQYIRIDEPSVTVTNISGAGGQIPIVSHSYDPDLHFYIIHVSQPLQVGKYYDVFIPFVSQILTNDTYGLYRGYYTDGTTNVTKNMATTFFQPFGARRAFPCFDEPDFKASFEISIGRLKKYHTLVNMNLVASHPDSRYSDWMWDHFHPSVPMSTYIVCIIVSDFNASTADAILYPKPVKVWGTPEAISRSGGVFAAEQGAKLLVWYENFTGIPYTLPKMDSIAIPQFAAGAMENWGLNTYRDAYLIWYPGDSDASYIGVAETLSHELSHQWFGNLATCEWWDQTWLNEGLATFFTYKALVNMLPEFDPEMRYIVRHHQNSLKFDSNENRSHPVVIPTDSGFDFFSGTSMEKSGSLTRMMEYLFGKPAFKLGLRHYLVDNAYQGAHQDSLFSRLGLGIKEMNRTESVLPSRRSVKDVMDTWTLQTGYPLIRVHREVDRLILSQENIISSQPSHTWWVPVTVVTEASPDFTDHTADVWMSPEERSISYQLNSASGWVVVNPDAVGFYRVLYSEELFQEIQEELDSNPNAFTPITRAQILDDWLNLGLQGFLPLLPSLKVTNYLPRESNPGVLLSAVKNIRNILAKSQQSPDFSSIKKMLVSCLEKILNSLGTEDQPDTMGLKNIVRNDILKILCEQGSLVCTTISEKYFAKLKSSVDKESVVPVNIRETVYCGIIKTGGVEAKRFFRRWHKMEINERKANILFKALDCGKSEASRITS